MSTTMTAKMSALVEGAYTKMLNDAIELLSKKYGFTLEEGQLVVGIQRIGDSTTKKEKTKLVLPWTGEGCENLCQGIRPSHGLYTQCTNQPGQDGYCTTCAKKPDKPTVANRDEWLATNGKKAKRYVSYLKEKGLSREDAEREALNIGVTIPEIEFETEVTSRGRPRKTAATSDTESDDEAPKRRGRPRNTSTSEDMFAELVAQHNANEVDNAAANEREKADNAAAKIAAKEKEKADKAAAKEKEKADKAAAKEKEKAAGAKIVVNEQDKAKFEAERENERAMRREKTTSKAVVAKKKMEDIFGATSEDSDTVVEENYVLEEDVLDEDVIEEDVIVWENNGVKYLLNKESGDVYDRKSQEHVGIWNGENLVGIESDEE